MRVFCNRYAGVLGACCMLAGCSADEAGSSAPIDDEAVGLFTMPDGSSYDMRTASVMVQAETDGDHRVRVNLMGDASGLDESASSGTSALVSVQLFGAKASEFGAGNEVSLSDSESDASLGTVSIESYARDEPIRNDPNDVSWVRLTVRQAERIVEIAAGLEGLGVARYQGQLTISCAVVTASGTLSEDPTFSTELCSTALDETALRDAYDAM